MTSGSANRPSLQSKLWVFTLNNYEEEDITRLARLVDDRIASYVIIGREVGASGTPHLQGFIRFNDRRRFLSVREYLGQSCHIEVARMPNHAIEYCKKEGDFTEYGTYTTQGQRNDIELFKADVKSGNTNVKLLREVHSALFARCRQFCMDYISDHIDVPPPDPYPLRPWQQYMNDQLRLPPDPRKIFFVVDVEGNSGKSWFARYWSNLHFHVQIMRPGKLADMAHMLIRTTTTLFLDCPRCRTDHLQYDFLESVKDGIVFSPKYESQMKIIPPCHVIVLMNEYPDLTKLSMDRYEVLTIRRDDQTIDGV